MSEVRHAVNETLNLNTQATTSWTHFGGNNEHDILSSNLVANGNYMLLVRALHSSSDGNSSQSYMRVQMQNGTVFAESNSRVETRQTRNEVGHPFGFLEKIVIPATPSHIQIRGKSDGVISAKCRSSALMAINLDDLAINDWKYAAIDVIDTTMDATIEDGASITLGVGTWVIWGFGRIDSGGTQSQDTILQIDVDGNTRARTRYEMEDSNELHPRLMETTFTVAAGTSVAKVQYGMATGTANDMLSTRIFAMRLDAYEDFAVIWDQDVTATTPQNTNFTVQSLSHVANTAAANQDWGISAFVVDDVEGSQKRTRMWVNGATIRFLGNNVSGDAVPHGPTDEQGLILFGSKLAHADAANLLLDIIVRDSDSPGNGQIDESCIAAWSWELAPASGPTSSGAPSIAKPTSTGASTVGRIATGAPSITKPTSTGASTVGRIATGAPSITKPTSTGVSTVGRIATGAPSIAKLTSTGASNIAGAQTSTGAPSIAKPTSTGASTVGRIATGAPSIAKLTSTGASTVGRIATGSPSISKVVSTGIATVPTPAVAGVNFYVGMQMIVGRKELNAPLGLTVDKSGGVSGLTVQVQVRDGNTVGSYLDFSDSTFKLASWIQKSFILADAGGGHYTGTLDINAVTNLPNSNHLALEYAISGAVTGVASSTLSFDQASNEVFSSIIEGSETFMDQVRLMRAEAAGTIVKSGTNHKVKSADGLKDRIDATADENGRVVNSVDPTL